MHSVLKRWGELEMKYAKEHRADDRLTLFTEEFDHHSEDPLDLRTLLTLWRECFVGHGYETRADEDAALKRGEGALEHFFTWWNSKKRTVLAVEKGFSLELPAQDTVLSGRFDRVEISEQGLEIIDYKTGAPQSQDQVDADVQLSIYALAAATMWKQPVHTLSLLSVREEGCNEILTTRNMSQLTDAKKMIGLIHERIKEKDFAATPSLAVCRRCPYKDRCPASMVR